MKKLIVLGIIATMVMGLAVAASAAGIPDDFWGVQLRFSNAAENALTTLTIGTKSGAVDAFVAPGEDGVSNAPKSGQGVGGILNPTYSGTDVINKDWRAPLAFGETKIWDITVYVHDGPAQNMIVTAWGAGTGDALLNEGGEVRVWLQYADGTMIYEFLPDVSGKQATPNFTGTIAYDGTNPIALQLVAQHDVPEPGSMLAMFSGLVGLVGFGIRRRK